MEAQIIEPEVTSEHEGAAVAVGAFVLTPIERVSIHHYEAAGRVLLTGSKRPIAILVRSGDREWRIEIPQA